MNVGQIRVLGQKSMPEKYCGYSNHDVAQFVNSENTRRVVVALSLADRKMFLTLAATMSPTIRLIARTRVLENIF